MLVRGLFLISLGGEFQPRSEGVSPSFLGEKMRVVGLDMGGGLILEQGGDVSIVTDLDTIEWFFPAEF